MFGAQNWWSCYPVQDNSASNSASARKNLRMLAVVPSALAYTLRSAPTAALRPARLLRMASTATSPVAGDVVTVNFALRPTDPDRVFEEGTVSFVLGRGGYLPSLHETIASMKEGDSQAALAVDAGFGEYMDAAKATLPIAQAPAGLKEGVSVMIQTSQGQQRAVVTEMNEATFTLDANHPKAGTKLELDVELLSVDAGAVKHEVATFAGGCFWGIELAYQREPGVVGTKVGYTQGDTEDPSYKDVCSGMTGHTEAVQVGLRPAHMASGWCARSLTVMRPLLCGAGGLRPEQRLIRAAVPAARRPARRERLARKPGAHATLCSASALPACCQAWPYVAVVQVANDMGTQYRHGIYPHSAAQREVAETALAAIRPHPGGLPVRTEVVDAATFWDAEGYHMQYLQKGGQDASKDAKETIRCYG